MESATNETFAVTCPYCGEPIELYVETDVRGRFVQDCDVCCRPWLVEVRGDGEEREVAVRREDDGS